MRRICVYCGSNTGIRPDYAEAARNLACSGAKAMGVTDCLNFGNPEKPEAFCQFKRAVEELFTVTVTDVHTYTTHGKVRTRGKFRGRRPDWKRAIVRLKDGDSIEFFEGV